jgi:hypothetical protein
MPNNTTINTHYKLLIECCKISYDLQKINNLTEKVTDWDSLRSSAYMHGIFPIVYDVLKSSSYFSDEIKEKFKATNFQISKENIMMTAELLKIIQLLQSHGIRTIVIKGPVLSHMIHNDITKRQFGDLDLLITPEQMYEAVKILTEHDYLSEYNIEFLKNSTLLKVGKDFPVRNINNHVLVEFHWKLFASRYIEKYNVDLFSQDSFLCKINNFPIETLNINTLLLYLLMHGSKHYWERIEWILDIDKLLRLYSNETDMLKILYLAKTLDAEFMFYLGLAVSQAIFDTPIEDSINEIIMSDEAVQKALKLVVDDIVTDSIKIMNSGLVSLENLDRTHMMKNQTKGLIHYYISTLFEVNELDVYMVNLPKFLSFLYYPIRFYRLFKQNILRIE